MIASSSPAYIGKTQTLVREEDPDPLTGICVIRAL